MAKRFPWIVSAVALVALLVAMPGLSQFGQSTGGIHGRVVDETGGALPGVSVVVKGPGAPQTIFTDARGEFHSVNLPPGNYTLTLALSAFSSVSRENVTVSVGRDTELTIPMKLSAVAATVTVTGETPVLDTRRVQTGATVDQQELKSIPTARDPWVILQTIPGVQLDRVNVAGSESGQQSSFTSKGSAGGTFQVDGVNMTDMSALGASAGYYDFDSFQEMQVITGGSDPSVQGSGAHLNMITKRGTNDIHGSARIFAVDKHFQSNNLPAEAKAQSVPLASGNHIDSVQDYGVEAGGPAWRDHLWLWGSYGRDQINLITAGGVSDKTTLEDFNAKVNAQFVPSNSIEGWYLRSDKLKFGRNAGPTHPQETTWDQILPQNTWKIQDSQVFSSSLFASVQYSGQNGVFNLTPEGGLAKQAFLDADGVWHNSYEFYSAPRPQRQFRADTSFFFNTGSLGHELKAGFSYSVGTPTSNVDKNLKAPTTDEFIAGVDHELLSGLAVGVNYTYRKFKDQLYSARYDSATGRVLNRNDYVQYTTLTGTLPNGSPYSQPVYNIDRPVITALGGVPPGFLTFNRPDFNTTYNGVELTLNKRLANRWLARGSFVYNANKQHVGLNGCADPTNVLTTSTVNAQTCRDNDFIATGGKGSTYLNSKWQFNAVGMYQLPLGFNIAANVYGRQGYPINYYRRSSGVTDKLTRNVVVVAADAERYKNLYEIDLRAEKVASITQSANLTLSLDLFNVTNQNTVLQRQNRLNLASTNTIREIQSPRIYRFGARLSF
ncbi:MAG: TonB-dependent receptor [Acidobacteria bacterium]|nr:TonB-dependent receptor [Acidobacteriota bacterium]